MQLKVNKTKINRKAHEMRIKRLKNKIQLEQLHSCLWERLLPLEPASPNILAKALFMNDLCST